MTSPMHSPLQSPLQPVMRSPLELRRRGGVSPASLFRSGEVGVYYDPSDMSTLFQDSAGTTPVTAAGQTVGKMLDLSGNGNHATQADASKRPILRNSGALWWLEFDGIDDFLSTAAIDFSGTDKVSAWCGVTKVTVATQGAVYSFGGLPSLGSMEVLNTSAPSVTPWAMYADGSFSPVISPEVSVPDTAVLYQQVDLTGTPKLTGQYNGAPLNAVNNLTSSAMGNYPLHIASRGGLGVFFNGNLYPLIIAGALYDANTKAKMNAWTAKKTGVTL